MDVIELLWGERGGPRRGPKPTLTVGDLARAGIELADKEGLAAVTMQRVAEALGVTKMATYRYVPGKDELIALMVDVAIGEPPELKDITGGWRPRLKAWTLAMYERMSAHPWALRATTGQRVSGPNELGWVERALQALDGVAMDGGQMMDVVVALTGQIRVIVEQSAGTSEEDIAAGWTKVLATRQEQFPHVTKALLSSAQHGSRDQGLEFGLERILDGVELHLSRQ
ncbi:TetR/AcrR family transcriptional regulator [Kutzneria kofuensis]|uniref:AcrR family transcriptional regulator n=1 Tax=Kutzneria kofuensis TaxID=103725 RepID=A0A7W9KA46_9PSEU|nr:TetR/AcrR family transcriptional regulator [Kutzneria kofuensis]MBB5888810.1 AcrR family transcriptional regulator [Kutzneria kofuensis]